MKPLEPLKPLELLEPSYEQIHIVKTSWKPFRRIDPKLVGDVFYSKLFMEHPSLRKMFSRNMEEQYLKLFDMVNIFIARLSELDRLETDIVLLARRHVQYGVKPEHYSAVGCALIWTIKQGMGRDWVPDVANAWIACYRRLSSIMINASKETV